MNLDYLMPPNIHFVPFMIHLNPLLTMLCSLHNAFPQSKSTHLFVLALLV
jgi:hypothetical protein